MIYHKCRIIKGGPCVTYCDEKRLEGIHHMDKWRDVDCEKCKAEGLRVGDYQPGNLKARGEGK